MADINIVQEHALSPEQAKAAAQKVADKLAGEYGLEAIWQGDALVFERTGISGRLALLPRKAQLDLRLSGMMGAFAPMVEDKLTRKMRQLFGDTL